MLFVLQLLSFRLYSSRKKCVEAANLFTDSTVAVETVDKIAAVVNFGALKDIALEVVIAPPHG